MPFKKVEYTFPDEEDNKPIDIEPSSAIEIDISGKKTAEESEPADTVEVAEVEDPNDGFEVEVIDDTPKADQGRKASDPPEEVTEEELSDYSEKVRKGSNILARGTTTNVVQKSKQFVQTKNWRSMLNNLLKRTKT